MKKYFGIICMMFILSFPFKTKAECGDEVIAKFQRLSSNIMYNYTYKENNGDVTFDIIFTNLNSKLTLYDRTNNKYYVANGETVIRNLKPNTSYEFEVYSFLNTCTDESFRTMYIRMPNYNKYYSDELCKGVENYKYCQKWRNVNISYEDFKKNIQRYKLSLSEEKKEEIIEKSILDKIIDFISLIYIKYYYIILSLIIIISIITLVKKNNESKLK